MADIDVVPITPSIGAEVRGVDLANELDDPPVARNRVSGPPRLLERDGEQHLRTGI